MALGAGETTVLRLVSAYAVIDNGGKSISPTLIDRIQNRFGETIFRHDKRICEGCRADEWAGQDEPTIIDPADQVLDPMTAYQMTSMLEGVVQRGTATVVKSVGKPLAGKTGTTNDYRDAWFVGFSPDLVVGVYVGFDQPQTLGSREAGSAVAGPIFKAFMEEALADTPGIPFRIPPGVDLVRIDADTGLLPGAGTSRIIVEAFKVGTEPTTSVQTQSLDASGLY
jgi:penicillin-binding protein 1A